MKRFLIAALVLATLPTVAQAASNPTCWTPFPGMGWFGHLFQIQCDAVNNPGGGIGR
jgi:opacity protein-like surface antigen